MTLLASSHTQHRKPIFLARIRAWFASRPTSAQRRTAIDLQSAPQNLQRDIGLDRLAFTERRW